MHLIVKLPGLLFLKRLILQENLLFPVIPSKIPGSIFDHQRLVFLESTVRSMVVGERLMDGELFKVYHGNFLIDVDVDYENFHST